MDPDGEEWDGSTPSYGPNPVEMPPSPPYTPSHTPPPRDTASPFSDTTSVVSFRTDEDTSGACGGSAGVQRSGFEFNVPLQSIIARRLGGCSTRSRISPWSSLWTMRR